MTAILIDDEQHARESLRILIQNYCPTVDIIGEADSGLMGIEAIQKYKPDLVFLDVEIGDMTSFDMLDAMGFPNIDFEIIFSTAHDHYAVSAFRYSALDFLPKPVRERNLQFAVMKAQERLRDKERLAYYETLKANLKPQAESRMVLRTMTGIFIVPMNEIVRFQTVQAKTMTEIIMTNKRQQLIAKNIGEYENLEPFIRVHNANIINPNHIVRILKNAGGWQVEMTDGDLVEVAKSKRDNLMEWVDQIG
jgi:two-component system, LytTR family, response regulator